MQDCTLHPLFVVQLYFCSCSQSALQQLAGGWGCPPSSPVSAYRADGAISGQLQSSCSCFDASVHGTPGTCSWVLCFCIMQLWSCSCRCLPQVQQWLPRWLMGWQCFCCHHVFCTSNSSNCRTGRSAAGRRGTSLRVRCSASRLLASSDSSVYLWGAGSCMRSLQGKWQARLLGYVLAIVVRIPVALQSAKWHCMLPGVGVVCVGCSRVELCPSCRSCPLGSAGVF